MALAALPTELVENIAQNLDLDSFRSFRLTCSSLNQQSLYSFRDRFFQCLTLVWELDGFHTLVEITKHPYLGTALQHLIIDATPYHAIQLWQLQKRIADLNPIYMFKDPNLTDVYALEKKLTTEQSVVQERATASARFWTETQTDLCLLTNIFRDLKRLESVVFAYTGMDKEYGKFGRRYCESSQNEMSRPFAMTMAAIAASNLSVSSISTSPTARFGAVSIGRMETLSPCLPKFDSAFENLRTLKMSLRDWRHPEEGFEPPPGKIPFIVRFLAKCKQVQELEISCFSTLEGDAIIREMGQHCHFPYLQICKLELFRIFSVDDLFDFLAPCKGSLKRLSMSHIVLRDDTVNWADVMRRLANEYEELEFAELRSLFNRMGARVGIEGSIMGAIVVEGPEVRRKMTEVAEKLIGGNWGPVWLLASVAYPFVGMRI